MQFLKDVSSNVSKVYINKKQFNFSDSISRFENTKKTGLYTDIYDELNFFEELVMYYSLTNRLSSQSDWNQIKKYKEVRNRTMHAKDQLSYSSAKENLNQMLEFLKECKNIIDELSSGKP